MNEEFEKALKTFFQASTTALVEAYNAGKKSPTDSLSIKNVYVSGINAKRGDPNDEWRREREPPPRLEVPDQHKSYRFHWVADKDNLWTIGFYDGEFWRFFPEGGETWTPEGAKSSGYRYIGCVGSPK